MFVPLEGTIINVEGASAATVGSKYAAIQIRDAITGKTHGRGAFRASPLLAGQVHTGASGVFYFAWDRLVGHLDDDGLLTADEKPSAALAWIWLIVGLLTFYAVVTLLIALWGAVSLSQIKPMQKAIEQMHADVAKRASGLKPDAVQGELPASKEAA